MNAQKYLVGYESRIRISLYIHLDLGNINKYYQRCIYDPAKATVLPISFCSINRI